MPNNPFDRTILNVRERPLSSDINQLESQLDYALRFYLDRFYGYRPAAAAGATARTPPTGFVGDSFLVIPTTGMTLNLLAGLGFQYNGADVPTDIGAVLALDDRSPLKPLPLLTTLTLTIPTADATNPRIDLVEVRYDRKVGTPLSRDIFDPTSGAFNASLVNKALGYVLASGDVTTNGAGAINIKTGTPAASPVAPAVTAGYVAVSKAYVPASATTLTSQHLVDLRRMLTQDGVGARVAVNVVYAAATMTFVRPPTIVAPPGWLVIVQARNTGSDRFIWTFVFPPAGNGTSDPVITHSVRPIIAAGALEPYTASVDGGQIATTDTGFNALLSTGVKIPAVPPTMPDWGAAIFGAPYAAPKLIPLAWNAGTQLYVQPTAGDHAVNVDFTFPTE